MEYFLLHGHSELYIRLAVAMGLGMIIGVERIIAHKTAGMRTYALVTMGAALFAILSQLIFGMYPTVSYNPAYIAAAVITGVGFLGTGLMIWRDSQLIGLTSATSMWVCAGIGLASGYGYFSVALMATVLMLFVFVVLWFIEQKIKHFIPEHTATDLMNTETHTESK